MGNIPSKKHDLLVQAREAASGIDEALATSSFARSIADFEASEGPEARRQMLRELLSELASENRSKIDRLNYPTSVRALVHAEFDRIEKECAEKEDDAYDFQQFLLRCDFRITCFGRVPVGPQHMETGGLPGSVLLRGGLGQGFRFLRTLIQAGGRRPFFVLHLAGNIWPPAFRLVYSAAAQRKMFRNLAGCLEMNPQYRGVMSVGWLFDPQLDFATPQLSYLRHGWIDNGASLFYWDQSDETLHMATKNSKHRIALHEAGLYNPEAHMVIWPRRSLIAWAKQHPQEATAEKGSPVVEGQLHGVEPGDLPA